MLLAIPASAWSASATNSLKERDNIDTVLDDPLFSQSHMNLSFKNYWKYLKEEETEPKKVHNARVRASPSIISPAILPILLALMPLTTAR